MFSKPNADQAGCMESRRQQDLAAGWHGGRVAESLGLLRSLVVYWRPGRQRGLQRLYQPFVGRNDLVFDIGAHLGDRAAAFAALGARVVALEPQPRVAALLRRLPPIRRWTGSGRITVHTEAAGSAPGTAQLAISRRTPTVSTLSEAWRSGLGQANPGFRKVRWDRTVDVPVTTLDRLIERYGLPRFCKIDVEGYEAEVLAGLSRPLPALSVEFVAGRLDLAAACIRRLGALGTYEFNAAAGEQRRFVFDAWTSGARAEQWLAAGAGGIASGDLYARLEAHDTSHAEPRRGPLTTAGGAR